MRMIKLELYFGKNETLNCGARIRGEGTRPDRTPG
jgi:hypothetical protein